MYCDAVSTLRSLTKLKASVTSRLPVGTAATKVSRFCFYGSVLALGEALQRLAVISASPTASAAVSFNFLIERIV
jgi:hypothetical protein